MLTRLVIRNFKGFGAVEIELGDPVVFIGPNNSGKTSAMQALALWEIGLKRWNEKRRGKGAPERRPGVTVNRKDLFPISHTSAAHLWRDLHVRNVRRIDGRQQTANIRIEICVEGISLGRSWTCGLEFDYANEESFYCRPLRTEDGKTPARMPIPHEAGEVRMAFLPPMSGLAATETRLDEGALNVRVGEGRTAEVLRNLCFRVATETPALWRSLVEQMKGLFGVELEEPRYVQERGEITMAYREHGSVLDLSSSGAGLQQTLLILSYMAANPGAVILLDEPDAHLEILRQRQIYDLIRDVASDNANQVIAASHSEVLLNEAAESDKVIAFVGPPHRIGGGPRQVRKALAEIGFDQYYQAELTGWVLYLEGSTDLAILRALARRLGHERADQALERPFVHYVGNQPSAARHHFHGLREAVPGLKGIALYDRLDNPPSDDPRLPQQVWLRREIENYLCTEATLEAYARGAPSQADPLPLFAASEADARLAAMRDAIAEITNALETLGRGSPWDADVKASDDVLVPLFDRYFDKLGLRNLMARKSFHELAHWVPGHGIDPEIGEKLDAIAAVAGPQRPLSRNPPASGSGPGTR